MGFGLTFVLSIDIGWILVLRIDLFLPCKGFGLTFVPSVSSHEWAFFIFVPSIYFGLIPMFVICAVGRLLC